MYACGYLGLDKDYFWSLTIAEFSLISRGRNNRMKDEQMLDLYNTRTIAYYSVSPHVKKLPSIEKFMPLSIDKVGKVTKKHKWANLSEKELANKFGD